MYEHCTEDTVHLFRIVAISMELHGFRKHILPTEYILLFSFQNQPSVWSA